MNEFKHYYEYVDFNDKITRLIVSFQKKIYNLYHKPKEHNLRGEIFVCKVKSYKDAINRTMAVRASWVQNHNKSFQKSKAN